MAGSARQRHFAPCQPACRVDRDQKHPVEGRNSWSRVGISGHLGRSGLCPDGDTGRRQRRPRIYPLGGVNPRGRASLCRHGHRSAGRPGRMGAHRPRGSPARSVAPGQWHLGIGLGDHRWRTRDCVLRVTRHLRVRHGRQARCGRKISATSRCATSSAKAARRRFTEPPRRRVGSHQRVVRHGARQAHRQRAVARQPDEIDTWATPLVVEHAGRPQVIVPGMNGCTATTSKPGNRVAQPGLTMNPIPSPVGEDGIVFATSGFRGNNLKAIRIADAKGDLTGSKAIVWSLDRDTPYVPSPVLYDGFLYLLKSNSPILSVFDAKTGKPHYQLQRLDGTVGGVCVPRRRGGPRLYHRARRDDGRHQGTAQRSKCSPGTCWTTGSMHRRRLSTTKCT